MSTVVDILLFPEMTLSNRAICLYEVLLQMRKMRMTLGGLKVEGQDTGIQIVDGI